MENKHRRAAQEARLADRVAEALRQVGSVEELAAWLGAQPDVRSVTVSDYLVKTEPPLREFVVVLRRTDGAEETQVVDIRIGHDGTMSVEGVHDA
jgi:hypothetical protein